MERLSLHERKVIVGIDFGTTFSGIAWALIGDDQPHLITKWPDAPGILAPETQKVPTEILYDEDADGGMQWGYQIAPAVHRYQWFKIALEEAKQIQESAISKRYANLEAYSTDEKYSAQELTTDYLGALKDHLMATLRAQLSGFQLKNIPLEFIITVPAVWSEAAKEKTLVAAEDAGLGKDAPIHMISEPEAAAIYVLHRKHLHNLQVGDTFVVCDAGGGTVDLISYTVVKLDPVIEVKEAAPGTGALCGSTYLNRRFKEYLQSRLSHLRSWDNEVLSEAMDDFETRLKRAYSSAAKLTTYAVSVRGLGQDLVLGINKRGQLNLKSEDLKAILDPVISEVVKLVLEQIDATNATVKSVLLVGGFSGSKYLQERIRGAVKQGIEVINPPYAWSAVVQGAVVKGLAHYDPMHATVRLSSRIARKHIGTQVGYPFDEETDLPEKKYFDSFAGYYRISRMDWFIKKGDVVEEESPFKFNYEQKWLVSGGRPKEIINTIYCDRTGRAPVRYRDFEVEKLVELTADMSSIPENRLQQGRGKDGEMYYLFNFSIEVTYLSASTKYELVHKGIRYGTVTAEYA